MSTQPAHREKSKDAAGMGQVVIDVYSPQRLQLQIAVLSSARWSKQMNRPTGTIM